MIFYNGKRINKTEKNSIIECLRVAFGEINGDRTFEINLEFPLLGNILEHVLMWTIFLIFNTVECFREGAVSWLTELFG